MLPGTVAVSVAGSSVNMGGDATVTRYTPDHSPQVPLKQARMRYAYSPSAGFVLTKRGKSWMRCVTGAPASTVSSTS